MMKLRYFTTRRVALLLALTMAVTGFAVWNFQTTAQKVDKNFTSSEEEPVELRVDSHLTGSELRSDETESKVSNVREAPAAAFTNSTAITITDCPNPCPASGQAASLYPSPITVSGEVGVVQRVSVTLNGLSHAFPADVDFLLVSPSGRKSVIMSDFGAGSPGVSNINLTMDDYAQNPIPSTVTGNTGVPFTTGTYRPANSGTTDLFPATAPAAPYSYTLSAFNGDSPNGTWNLYIIDDANLDGGSISGGWTITFDVRPPAPTAGQVLISEFRTRGDGTTPPGSDGSADEFIEIYNNTDSSITIIDAIPGADPTTVAGAGWRFAGAQVGAETTNLVLPQTLSTAGPLALPARGYFLISTQPTTPSPAGNTYSLSTYPSGTGITASGSANVSINPASATVGFLPDDVGLAVFSTTAALTANRLDSVGYSSVTATDYKEGTGLAPAAGVTAAGQHSWVRRWLGNVLQDTNDNAADFRLVSTTGGVLSGVNSILGAPGPQRGPTMTAFTTTSAPLHNDAGNMPVAVIDPMQNGTTAPNLVRDFTPVTNGAQGTLKIRRQFTNNSGANITALKYRIVNMSTLTGGVNTPGSASFRVLNSPAQTITLTDTTNVTSQALTLQTPAAQALGGGVNSSLGEGIITTTAPLANGASTIVEFNLGVEALGPYQVDILVEGLITPPNGGAGIYGVSGNFSLTGCVASSGGSECTADLQITKTNGVASVTAGGATTYTITASNVGPAGVTDATVTDTLPAEITSATWTCAEAGGGTCVSAGVGNINDINVNLPVGGSVTYTVLANIAPGATGSLVNTATVSSSVTDPTPANNSATDTDTITPSGVGIQLCTLTAGGATYNIPATSHYDGTQTSNFTGVGTGDYLFEDGWWFRVAGDTQESFFPVPTATNCTGANGTVTWTNVSSRGLFDATNTLTLSSAGANQGQLILTMAVTNTTASPLTISLFHGADFDVNGSAGTDNATLVSPNTHIRVTDSTAGNAEQRAFNPAANAFLVRPFAATTDVFGVLGDAAVTNFDNTTLPSSNFDYTGAFQWNLVIPAGGTSSVSTALVTNVPATAAGVNVGGRVLTPEGRGVRGAIVTITDQNGVSHTVTTGVNGNFVFDDVEPGQTYVVNIRSRRFSFSPQVVHVNDNIADLTFIAGQ